MKRAALAAGLVAALLAAGGHAQVYRWTDKDGKVHYGDKPPEAAKEMARPVDTGKMDSSTTGGARSGDVRVQETEVEWFSVRGLSRREMRAWLQQTGPYSHARKSRVWSQSRWTIRWEFKHRREPGGACRIGEVTLIVADTVKLPRWEDVDFAPLEMREAWPAFVLKQRAHQEAKKKNGIDAARDLARRLRALEEHPTCAALNREVSRVGERVMSEYRQLDAAFDNAELLDPRAF